MAVRVLVVDDSVFFRNRISQILRQDRRIQIVGTAKNGREAIEQAVQLNPDVVTMDVEMPVLNGIEAVKGIMKDAPCQILMLSSLTRRSARVTLEALDAGAADYLEKDAKLWIEKESDVSAQVVEKVLALGNRHRSNPPRKATSLSSRSGAAPASRSSGLTRPATTVSRTATASSGTAVAPASTASSSASPAAGGHDSVNRVSFPPCKVVVIGSSTGGPAALQDILPSIPASFPYPILLVQHMPKTFTSVFAQRLNGICQINIKEAEDGDVLKPGHAYLAPGGSQMIFEPGRGDRVKVFPSDERVTYKPSVDVTFASAAKIHSKHVLGIVLTGMGADGAEGAKLLKQAGSHIWAQDQSTCTIFGMPKAVINAGVADHILKLNDIGQLLKNKGGR
ncbi:protein-glutamate methylesterase/protein-glutamine glutaminase [Aliamphritea spongicola]|uniref:protein-glutamate methylesterase/protein-glutamine glutaminase n=1 Tax=Aliamphritea spongicola TaxID=707589 RepID=UPI00196B3A93|nr:chemotaxis response regulator protein-glutamate methylesterase [Aliamphritea spongicola]MBN3563535.1 chemotaxis response regulator protein-glutamate methylesterase [Aliamphritea spongicola]